MKDLRGSLATLGHVPFADVLWNQAVGHMQMTDLGSHRAHLTVLVAERDRGALMFWQSDYCRPRLRQLQDRHVANLGVLAARELVDKLKQLYSTGVFDTVRLCGCSQKK